MRDDRSESPMEKEERQNFDEYEKKTVIVTKNVIGSYMIPWKSTHKTILFSLMKTVTPFFFPGI